MEEKIAITYPYEFLNKIENLYILHYITMRYKHMIGRGGAWTLYEPSKFIYAYFAFNSFYNIDWEKSIKEKEITTFEVEKKSIKCPNCKNEFEMDEDEISQGKMYKAMIDFIFQRVIKPEEPFLEIITERGTYSKQKIIDTISQLIPIDENTELDKKNTNPRIKESDKRKFVKGIEKILNNEQITVGTLKNDVIRFINLVRNNIFHGSKRTIEMSEDFQRKRLNIYSNILIAVNVLLFKVLGQVTGFKPQEKYSLPFEL